MSIARLLIVLALVVVVGLAFRWEEWDYRDGSGGTAFRYRGLLLPWQEATAPPAGVHVASVAVHKWSLYGLNRFDSVGEPEPPSTAALQPPVKIAWR